MNARGIKTEIIVFLDGVDIKCYKKPSGYKHNKACNLILI